VRAPFVCEAASLDFAGRDPREGRLAAPS